MSTLWCVRLCSRIGEQNRQVSAFKKVYILGGEGRQ